jgi:4-amino-4-deoxy-L-arabinose transferase-like glycosyltransferase
VQPSSRSSSLTQGQKDLLALGLILGVSLLFRSWQLDRFPPGLFGDEATNGLDALDVLAGRPQVFFPANFGREGLHMAVLALSIRLLGATPLALRLPSVLAGVGTALATYWLGRELLTRTRFRGILVPLMAALLLSTSYWHVHFSRFGIRGVFTPLMTTLAYAAFWRGANQVATGRQPWFWFLAAGLFLGLGVHFYTASRLVPIFLAVFLLLQWPLATTRDQDDLRFPKGMTQPGGYPPLLRAAFWPLVGLFALAAVVFAPLGYYFVRTPGSLTQRASAVSLFNPEVSGGNPWTRMGQAVVANVAQFFVPGAGDQATFYNLPGRSVFDPVLAMLAIAGLVICFLWVLRRSSPHLFLLLWLPVLLLPTFLAVDRFPTLPRALGVLPGIYLLPALTLGELNLRLNRHRWLAALVIVAVLFWQGSLTWRDYFTRWGPAAETFDAFEGDVVAAADWLAARPEGEVYLSTDIYRHPTFAFVHEQVPLTEILSYQDPLVHFFDGRNSLPLPPYGQPATYLFTHNAGPDSILQMLPGWRGFTAWQEMPGPGGPSLVVAQMDAATAAAAAGELWPANIPFEPNLRLVGYRMEKAGPEEMVVFLLWHTAQPEQNQPHGLQVQAGLASEATGEQFAQASAELAHRATEWVPGGSVLSWLRVPVPADMPEDGNLALRLVNQANGVPLRPPDADEEGWVLLALP